MNISKIYLTRKDKKMKKEQTANNYANLGFVTTAPKRTDKNGARAATTKSGKDMRGGKK